MIETITNLLIAYKYWVVIGGALIEGEVILLLAAGAAYHGYLDIYLVMLISFLGAVLHDNVLFFVGRHGGERLFKKYPVLREKSKRVFSLFHQYQTQFVLGFRFVYGIRTITPIIIGTTEMPFVRYTSLTTLAAFIWSVTVSALGYGSAIIIESIIEKFEVAQKYIAAVIILIAFFGWLFHKFSQRKKGR